MSNSSTHTNTHTHTHTHTCTHARKHAQAHTGIHTSCICMEQHRTAPRGRHNFTCNKKQQTSREGSSTNGDWGCADRSLTGSGNRVSLNQNGRMCTMHCRDSQAACTRARARTCKTNSDIHMARCCPGTCGRVSAGRTVA